MRFRPESAVGTGPCRPGHPSRADGAVEKLEHDAEKCERFSDNIMLHFFAADQRISLQNWAMRAHPSPSFSMLVA
ncbi:hypothetical protein ELI13_29555 (plasmid) [Rhizobium ruizarguesonis]|nr:hypothetical protein ELI46_30655 [Rhizobium ruizarguesonis]TAV20865.1 hypothetical protein ELI35_34075 [Rhizobium ruizarguesonis]TAW84821.1 hypothetical protein ELI13_29555 [Rhizobium ruizarguesonis]TAZ46515.1 hypothetical protein ELH71_32870 [Rhizobium ruizarguesonis]